MKASPAELLDLPSTAVVLDGLRALADYVLLDSPPVLSAADASILAQRADGVVLVAEAGRVRREAFSEAVTTLQRVNAKVVGVVLNKVSAKVGGVVLNKVSAKLGGVVLNKVSAKLGGHAYRHSHYRSTPVNEGRGRRKETPHPAERRTRGLLRRGFRPQQ